MAGFETFNNYSKIVLTQKKGIGVMFSHKESFHFQKFLCRAINIKAFGTFCNVSCAIIPSGNALSS